MKSALLLLPLCFALTLRAADFTPESAAAFALRQNRDLVAARHLIGEAEARLVQAGLWANPEFEFKADRSTRRGGDRLYEAGFLQRFPFSGRLVAAREAARVNVALAVAELRNQERLLAGQVLAKARALLILDRRLALNRENLELLDRIFQQTSSLAATGQTSAAEAGVIELEKTTLQLAGESLAVEQRAKLAELNGLLGRAPTEALSIRGALPVVRASNADAAAAKRRPDRLLAALQIDRARAEISLARSQRWEDVGIGLSVSREREDRSYDTMLGLKVAIPLPLWNQNQGRLAEAQIAQRRAEDALAARDLAIVSEIREARVRAEGLASVVARLRGGALELARRNTKLLQDTYAAGATSFLTVFESRKQRLAVEQNALGAEEQLALAITDWETRSGLFPAGVRVEARNSKLEIRSKLEDRNPKRRR